MGNYAAQDSPLISCVLLSSAHDETRPAPSEPPLAMLADLLDLLERDRSLSRSFATRSLLSERLETLRLAHSDSTLQRRAAQAIAQLEAADERFIARLRARLQRGLYTPAGLVRGLWQHAEREDAAAGYAPLDVLLAGLLDAGELPDELPRTPEMVAYQPAPGRVILALLDEVRADDVFYDLGSGLGRVVIMVALLTGARARGIELQPSFCAYATRAAAAVTAHPLDFSACDARDAAFGDGTLFFLYTPFRGALLREVMGKLRAIAADKPIRVATFGPCTPEVAEQPWLTLRSTCSLSPDELAVFDS
jgi:hypothetical protein